MTVKELINKLEKIEDKERIVVTTEYDSEDGAIYVRELDFVNKYNGYYELDGRLIKVQTRESDLNTAEVVDKDGNITYY